MHGHWGSCGCVFPSFESMSRGASRFFFSESSRSPRYRVTAAGFCLPLGFWRVLAFSAILSLVEGASSQLASSCRYQFETPYMYFFFQIGVERSNKAYQFTFFFVWWQSDVRICRRKIELCICIMVDFTVPRKVTI